MIIQNAETDEQIAATFHVMHQLRPHLSREEYLPLVRGMMASDGSRQRSAAAKCAPSPGSKMLPIGAA